MPTNKSDEFKVQEFVKSGHEEISNGITKRLASEGITIEEMYKSALYNISQFHFIGFTELINESLSYMSNELSLKTFNLGKENYTNKEEYTFTHKEIELIRSFNKYDIGIYEKCINKFKHKIVEFNSTHKKQKKLNFQNMLNLFYNNVSGNKIKSFIKRIPLAKKYLRLRHESNYYNFLKARPPVFIYQMGKVASSSVYVSLKEQYKGICIHAHSFTENHERTEVRLLYKVFQKDKIPLKIISLVREPVSRNISAFFQNFERDTGIKHENNPYSIDELLIIFLENYKHDIPLVWFDNNIHINFGIDVYYKPFPERGYDTFKNGNVELLLLKHDIADDIKEMLISDFIGNKDFKLKNKNIGAEKDYASTYNEFKTLSLPNQYLNSLLNSKYVNHFYTKDLAKIREKWAKKAIYNV